jgi:virginiamycin B lyase
MADSVVKPAKYYAFLSYSHADEKAAARLSRYLETFRVPVRLGGPEQKLPKRMKPIFRDRDEFAASPDLGAAINQALASSGALIVLCSPAAAKSEWVNKEIEDFKQLGHRARIFAVLLEGEPHESFPAALIEGGIEPLATDFRPAAHDVADAHLRLVAALLGIDFDSLKRRERIRVRKLRLQMAAAGLLVTAAIALGIGFGVMNARDAHRQRNVAQALTFASKIREFAAPAVGLESAITVGSDGVTWFTEAMTPRIAQITSDGITSEKRISGADGFGGITPGKDGILWLADGVNESLDRISPDGSVAKFSTGEDLPGALTIAPDGTIWFAEVSRNKIGRMRIGRTTADFGIKEFPIPTRDSYPKAIAIGPNGTVWFTETYGIGRITTDGKITEISVPAGTIGITVGPDRAMWFTEGGDKIGRIAADGKITETRTPTQGSGPSGITVGPDGAVWFAESAANKIGRIGPNGDILEIPLPTPLSKPREVVAGRDGTLWFTEPGTAKIGVLQVTPQRVVTIEMLCSFDFCGQTGDDLTRRQDLPLARAYKRCLANSGFDDMVDLINGCVKKVGIKFDLSGSYKGPLVYIATGKPGKAFQR